MPRSVERNKNIEYRFDLSVFFDYGNLPQEQLVLIEIKSPTKMNNGKRPDYVKLGNEMKAAIDKMIMDGLDDESIPVIGLLIEGEYCLTNIYSGRQRVTFGKSQDHKSLFLFGVKYRFQMYFFRYGSGLPGYLSDDSTYDLLFAEKSIWFFSPPIDVWSCSRSSCKLNRSQCYCSQEV